MKDDTKQFNMLAELNQLKSDALNIEPINLQTIIDKWKRCIGITNVEILALYYFYSNLEKSLKILSPDFNLALHETNRLKATVELSIWSRFNNDAEFFFQ